MLPVSSLREGPRRDALTSTDSASGILTAIKYRGEILGPTIRPYTGAVGPGLPPMYDKARPHEAKLYKQILEDEGIDNTDPHAHLT